MRLSFKYPLMFCLAVLVCLLQVVPVWADQEEANPMVTMKVSGAYGNYARTGTWVAVKVDVNNQGQDIKGQVRIYQNVNGAGPATAVNYVTPAVLPQGSTKRFELTIPVNNFVNSLQVELVSGSEVLVKEKAQFTFLGPEQLVIGLVDRSEEGLGALSSVKTSNNLAPQLLQVKSKELSDKPEVLGLFNVLLVDDVNFKLQPEQAKALAGWVSRGGTLIVGGGPGWQKVYPNLPGELPKVSVSGEQTKTLATLPNLLSKPGLGAPSGSVQLLNFADSGGVSRFVDKGQPLAVEQSFGSGKVIYLAFDPALEPMAGWSGSKVLWQDLLASGNVINNAKGVMKGDPNNNLWMLANALNNIPGLKLPSVTKMLWVLAIYLLCATVLNYLILKKLDRREWTWFTLPAMSLLFVVVIYFTSFQSRPSEVIANQITVVDVNPDSQAAKATTATGVFAPTYNNYKINLAGDFLVNPLPGYDDSGPKGPNDAPEPLIEVEQTPGQTSVELKKMRSWVMRSFLTSNDITMAGSVSAEIVLKGNKWVGVISNNTGYDFTDGVLMSNPFWFAKTGGLKAGEKLEVDIPESSLNSNGQPLIYQIYQINGPMQGKMGGEMLRQQVMSHMFENSQDNNNQLVFIGWSEQPVKGAFTLKEGSVKQFYTSAFKVPLRIKVQGNDLNLPPGIVVGKIIDSSNVGMGPPGMVFMQPNSSVTYQLDLPEGSFNGMKLYVQTTGGKMGPGGSQWTASLYNWQKQGWEDAALTDGGNEIKDYGKYVSNQRRVRLKLDNKDGGFQLSGVTVSLGKGGGKK